MLPALAVILIPAVSGGAAFLLRRDSVRRALLVGTAVVHAGLSAAVWTLPSDPAPGQWLFFDPLGRLFLSLTSALFLAAAVYAVGYLRRETAGRRPDLEEDFLFSNASEAMFTGCLLLFLSTMSFATASQHLGLLWVAIEATTLASAPLIYFHRHHRSLEATWKYLMLGSVGIALSLLGNFFLAVSASSLGGVPMEIGDLVARAEALNVPWLKASFLFLLVGYGTKMGLAPLHTWLPDAHSEAPSVVSALLSGALLNCAALGILRGLQVCAAAGEAAFGQELLVGFGLLSMAVAVVFLVGQPDYKRMLAYSSVEHMGILALGIGLGGAGSFGAILHAVNHSLTKAMLFLVSGNILAAYGSKTSAEVRGLFRLLPVSGMLWFGGFLAVAGSPPFGPFLSEFTILRAAFAAGRFGVAAAFLALLALAFVGMAAAVLRMTQGDPPSALRPAARDTVLSVVPPAALGLAVLLLGLYVPPGLRDAIHAAARSMGLP